MTNNRNTIGVVGTGSMDVIANVQKMRGSTNHLAGARLESLSSHLWVSSMKSWHVVWPVPRELTCSRDIYNGCQHNKEEAGGRQLIIVCDRLAFLVIKVVQNVSTAAYRECCLKAHCHCDNASWFR